MLCQSKVPTETMIITAVSAAIGMIATTSPSTTTRINRKTPARKVEIRVRAPDCFTLIMVWPIMAQPPIPPKIPVTTLAMPWPIPSRVLFDRVSVMPSTSLAVISDSSRPTRAIPKAVGATICSVSRVSGTCGRKSPGRLSGSWPSSPTVGTPQPIRTTNTVITMIAISGAGTTRVSFGKPTMIPIPTAINR